MDAALLFEAGRVAAARGWQSPEIVPVEQARHLAPSGGPVILISPTAGIAPTHARAVATLVGAGRRVLLIAAADVSAECAVWLPPGTLHVTGTPSDTASPPVSDPPTTPTDLDNEWDEPLVAPLVPTTPFPTVVIPTVIDPEFERKCRIVAEAWPAIRDLEQWEQLVAYGDVGFPLAYSVTHGLAEATQQGSASIEEIYRLLISNLDISDFAYASFDQMLNEYHSRHPPDPTPPLPPPMQEPVAVAAAGAPECVVCGAGFAPGDVFCGNCGTAR